MGLVAAGCAQHSAPPALASAPPAAAAGAPAPAAPQPTIAWFNGSVEQAFAAARAQNKPVFLYWGAKWCPPCHELKATVFSRPDFIGKLRLFVPVQLDGDDPGAQKWGEKFGVSGYPTVLVLSADQGELARISGGMDLAQYAEVLDLVLGDVRPLNAILATLATGQPLSHEDCRRLQDSRDPDPTRPGLQSFDHGGSNLIGRAGQHRNGRHAPGHAADDEAGADQQQVDAAAVQGIGEPVGEPVQPRLGGSVDVVGTSDPDSGDRTEHDDLATSLDSQQVRHDREDVDLRQVVGVGDRDRMGGIRLGQGLIAQDPEGDHHHADVAVIGGDLLQ